jgi:hypothetical protein
MARHDFSPLPSLPPLPTSPPASSPTPPSSLPHTTPRSPPAADGRGVTLGESYVDSPTLSDVTFTVEGRPFRAHRTALLASSDAFRCVSVCMGEVGTRVRLSVRQDWWGPQRDECHLVVWRASWVGAGDDRRPHVGATHQRCRPCVLLHRCITLRAIHQ